MSQGVHDGRLLANRYRLISVVGQGGMGTVWRAVDVVLDREVAVKEVLVGRSLADHERELVHSRTLREARATARLNHPGIVTVHDVVAEDDRPWIVMEFVRARSLQSVLDEEGPQLPRWAAEVGRQTLAALRAAHAVGVLHRDVKPANVLITGEGRAVLTDFGIAKMEGDSHLTQAGQLMGSPAFIAPERVRGEDATAAADLWALGATLYAVCEGRPPFAQSNAMAVLTAIATQDPPPPVNAGPLAPVIQGLLHPEPAHRLDAGTAADRLARIAYDGARQPGPESRNGAPPIATARDPWPTPPPTGGGGTVESTLGPLASAGERRPGGRHPGEGHSWPTDGGRRGHRGTRAVVIAVAGVLAVAAVVVGFVLLQKDPPGQGTAAQEQHGQGGHPPPPPPDGRPPGPQLPYGWQRVSVPGGTIGVPPGWRRSEKGRSVYFNEPGSATYLQVDGTAWDDEPIPAWQRWETDVRSNNALPGYWRITLHEVTDAPYKAADIEFTWNGRAGVPMHGVDRRIIAHDGRRSTVFVAIQADRWDTSRDELTAMLNSFAP